ncbi:histidine phosphatase family protein [Pseudoalteromonas shioyasakiensis]|uniref:histidine phosphatase family protein n=1 Tax=Pseudoalteromonas shioyasakiensis TaxID=1190813 RepID=UPI002117589D|nr:histidine phosphatase family protein [Pseudoalteromonas shioyasakiensis]MCQ8878064.1 histidine phosphatase family protein [Pseudoalteromonas shioyasakiensis]
MKPFTTKIYLLRHGELEQKNVLAGQSDFLLTKQGYQQLQDTVSQLGDITAITSSPLMRCQHFAQALAKTRQLPLSIEAAIAEYDFGDWDGQSYEALWQQTCSPTIGDFWQTPWQSTPPNGESMSEFYSRVENWWRQLLATITTQNAGAHLVITHAGVIKQILAFVCQLPRESTISHNVFSIPYAGYVCIELYIDEKGEPWPKIAF